MYAFTYRYSCLCLHISLFGYNFTFMFTSIVTVCPLEVFSALCSKYLPDIHRHLESLQVLKMISVSWFLTLFIAVLDHTTAVNIIDCFFVDGSKVS